MTPRQQKLLKAITDEFIETAQAVGSVNLANKYRLGISPATIRNEMADLVDQGYLMKAHTSSGRIPTNLGFKFFINSLLEQLDEIFEEDQQLYEEFFQIRFDKDQLLRKAVELLSEISGNTSLILLNNKLYFSGLANLTRQPEFQSMKYMAKILNLLEDKRMLSKVFETDRNKSEVMIIVGADSGWAFLERAAVIFGLLKMYGNEKGYIAIIGPNRMNYQKILPVFNYVTKSLNKVVNGW